MKSFTVMVGLFDRNSKQQEITTIDAYKVVAREIIHYCGGGTIQESKGIYTHDNGEVVVEPSLVISILDTEREQVMEFVQRVGEILNQESILVQENLVSGEFVAIH